MKLPRRTFHSLQRVLPRSRPLALRLGANLSVAAGALGLVGYAPGGGNDIVARLMGHVWTAPAVQGKRIWPLSETFGCSHVSGL